LFIAPVMPEPAGNGLAMRQAQFLTAYAPHFAIDLAVIPVAGPAAASPTFARRHAARLEIFPPNRVDTQFSFMRRLKDPAQRLAAFEAYGKPSIQARLTADIQTAFASWITGQSYNLIHVGRLYMLALQTQLAVPCLVDADEDDARVLAQIAAQSPDPDGAAWARIEARHAAASARHHLPRVTHIFTASTADAQALVHHGPAVTVIPNNVIIPHPARRPRNNILFVGTLGYPPNLAGVIWFLKYCWPILRKTMPGGKFHIAGSGGSLRSRDGAICHGWVRNLAPFYAQARTVIVPIHAGGGSRIKLLEAAAYGVPVVATRIGAEGTSLRPGRDFLLADDPARFIKAIRKASHSARLGAAARRAVARHHDPARIRRRIVTIALDHLI
jgi:glycosyltransferase involved in cell wall biosynthesis